MDERETGELTGMIEQAWVEFGEGLDSFLEGVDDGGRLTLEVIVGEQPHSGQPPQVQFTRVEDEILLLLRPDADLARPYRLRGKSLRRLERWGFTLADAQAGSPHFTRVVLSEDPDFSGMTRAAVKVLRRLYGVIHPALLEVEGSPDLVSWMHLIQVAPPEPTAYALPEQEFPADPEVLRDLIGQTLSHLLGETARPDQDGDYPVQVAGWTFWVRPMTGAPCVEIFGAVIDDVSDRRHAYRVLRRVNAVTPVGTFEMHGHRIGVVARVPAAPYVPEHLIFALHTLGDRLEETAGRLLAKVGGHPTRGY